MYILGIFQIQKRADGKLVDGWNWTNFDFVNRILLDNYNPKELVKALSLIRGRKKTEASGRIKKKNIVEYAETGVDFVPIGELTNNIKKYRKMPQQVKHSFCF